MTKILLVEDDKSLSEIYSVRLQAEGYDLISSGDGEQALSVAISERPDLIISDVMMPKISGFEMLDLLRSNNSTKNIPVIILTALSSEQQRERGSSLGANRYLIKSQIGIEDIIRTVHELLQESAASGNAAANAGQYAANGATNSIGAVTYQQAPSSVSQTTQNTSYQPQIATTASERAQSVFAPRTYTPPRPAADAIVNNNVAANNSSTPTPSVAPTTTFTPTPSSAAATATPESYTVNSTPTPVNNPLPSPNQSPFNPQTATNPSAVVGVDTPPLPDQPMDIPAVSVPPVKQSPDEQPDLSQAASPVIDIDKLLADAGDEVVNPAIFPSNQ